NIERIGARSRRRASRRPPAPDSARPVGIFHRSPADRHAAAGCCADRCRQSRDSGRRNAVSGGAGGALVSRRGDSTRMTVLEAVDLTKTFVGGDGGLLTVLDGVSLQVEQGEMVAIVGASGAGKSTLLHLLGALDRPTRGHVVVSGEVLDGLNDDALAAFRNRQIGFVFQFHHLLREFSAHENVTIPLRIAGWDTGKARERAADLL